MKKEVYMQDKKRLVKKMLGGLLTVSMIFGLMPGTTLTAYADTENYDLYVGAIRATSANKDDITANHTEDDPSGVYSGTASYNPETNTLTLNNFSYSGSGCQSLTDREARSAIGYVGSGDFTIKLIGTNTITHTDTSEVYGDHVWAIFSSPNLIINGDGELTVTGGEASTSGSEAICSYSNSITINGGTINATGGEATSSVGIWAGKKLIVNGGVIQAEGKTATQAYSYGAYGGSGITINGGELTGIAGNAGSSRYNSFGVGGDLNAISDAPIIINGGKVIGKSTATTGWYRYGIWGKPSTTIKRNTYVEASGTKAIGSKVKNEVKGLGWNNTEDEGTVIESCTSDDGEVYSYKKVLFDTLHEHAFIYSSDGATITATCGNTSGCPLAEDEYKTTLKIEKPTRTVYGGEGSASATLSGIDDFNSETGLNIVQSSIKYAGRGSTTYNETATPPTVPGTYTASITVEEKTATVEYTIAKAEDPEYSKPTNTFEARYGDTLSTVELPAKWSWKTPSTKITATGEQSFTAIYTPGNTALYETVEMLLTVKVDRAVNPAVVETTATVTKGGRTVDLSKNVDTKDAGGEVSYSIYSTEDLGCTVNPETGEFKSGNKAGEVEVQVSVGGDGHYYETSKTITVTITDKENQTLEFASDNVSKTYGDAAFTNALSGAKTAVTYEVTDGKDVADVDSTGKVTIKKIGEAVITATAAETDAYTAATESYTVKVIRKSITVKADDKEIEIGDPEPELTATVTGLVGTDTVEYEIERETGNSLGKYTITPFGDEEQGNYKVAYETGILTIKEGEKYIRKPVIKTISSDMIAVETVEGYVYGISDSDDYPDEWTAEGVFTDLDENTEYTVFMKLNGEGDDKSTSTKVVTNEKGKETVIEEEHRAVGNGFVRTEVRINRDAIVGKIENLTPDMISSFFGESSEIINKVKNGSTLLVYLKVENADESVPEDDKKKIEDTAKDNSNAIIAQYLDLSLYMQIDDNEPELISNLNSNKILVRINIPEQFRGDSLSNDMDVEEASQSDNRRSLSTDRKYYIARVHDGETDILDTTVDGDDITFETDRFSTYALLYSDSTVDPTVEPGADKKQSETGLILVVKNKSNISNLFSKYGESGYKYKFRVEDRSQRKIMTVSRKGKIRVKKVGTATVALYRKVKRGSWSKIEEQTLTSEMPDLPKKVTNLKVGDKVYAESFITNKMVNKPMSYKSSRPSVASIDSNTGLITVNKTGTTRISIIYGNGKGAAQYKVRLKIQ